MWRHWEGCRRHRAGVTPLLFHTPQSLLLIQLIENHSPDHELQIKPPCSSAFSFLTCNFCGTTCTYAFSTTYSPTFLGGEEQSDLQIRGKREKMTFSSNLTPVPSAIGSFLEGILRESSTSMPSEGTEGWSPLIFIYYWSIVYLNDENSCQQVKQK